MTTPLGAVSQDLDRLAAEMKRVAADLEFFAGYDSQIVQRSRALASQAKTLTRWSSEIRAKIAKRKKR
jgi:HD superfamily phosphodiesterase